MCAVLNFGEVKHLGHLELVTALMVTAFEWELKALQFFFSVTAVILKRVISKI